MSQGSPGSFKKFFSKKLDEEKVEEEILSIVEEGYEQGVIEDNEAEMISNIFEFGDKDARDIMTSRKKIVAIKKGTQVDEALRFALDNSFSRYPVYDEDIDNIIGVVHIRDLTEAYLDNPVQLIDDLMEAPLFVHPTCSISKLLHRMQKEKTHMSIVVDEYGQTEGLAAMEDIIEEIVGNIFDEHDEEEERDIHQLDEKNCLVEGSAPLEELEEVFGLEFPDEDIETVNGFLLFQLGRLPVQDEKIEIVYQGYKFIPVEISGKMITLVRVEKIKQEDEDKE